ncbi:MAG: hypothetical protein OXI37_07830 [Gammaproteobacteria bacterium]|nr:hypothetical protein [Gammaproteobacteria bacterium]
MRTAKQIRLGGIVEAEVGGSVTLSVTKAPLVTYYVNKYPMLWSDDESLVYKVHTKGCSHLPGWWRRKRLGKFRSCRLAVAKACLVRGPADGCYFCCRECYAISDHRLKGASGQRRSC